MSTMDNEHDRNFAKRINTKEQGSGAARVSRERKKKELKKVRVNK
jgi:hypothetical protein